MGVLKEIKERSIIQVTIAYIAIAWILVQVADVVLPTFGAPEWVMKVLVFLLIIGFPVALILAWAQGLRKQDYDTSSKPPDPEAQPLITKADPATVHDKSIAVLPFDDMSPDKDHDYFSDGMAEEILNLLARIPDLKVTGRTSSFSFKGTKSSISDIGAALNVAHILEGSVRKSGNKLRITVQLIKVDDGFHLWSENYDRELEDVFSIQDEIALSVTRKLQATLLGKNELPIRQTPDNLEAYELVLKGLHFYRGGMDHIEQSLIFFQRALEIEPDYGFAHLGIATYYFSLASWGYIPPADGVEKIKSSCMNALAQDPDLSLTYARLALTVIFFEWNWPEAKVYLDKGLALNPNEPTILSALSHWLYVCGDMEGCIAAAGRAVMLDPLNVLPRWLLGNFYSYAGQYAKAEKTYKAVLELDPNHSESVRMLADVYCLTNRSEKALECAERAYQLQSGNGFSSSTLAHAYVLNNRPEEARRLLDERLDKVGHEHVMAANVAFIAGRLGETDKAFEWIEKSYDRGENSVMFQMHTHNSLFERLDPSRFDALVKRMNLPSA